MDPDRIDLGQMTELAPARKLATVEGLDVGSGGYLAKPFTAGSLVARVRSMVELSRLRLHESRFGRALIESLEEGFFVCDEQGVFLDVNDVFGEIVGYGPESLPYPRPYPWSPTRSASPNYGGCSTPWPRTRSRPGPASTPARSGARTRTAWCTNAARPRPRLGYDGRVFTGTVRDVTAEREAADRPQ